jgi:hypothetical protein
VAVIQSITKALCNLLSLSAAILEVLRQQNKPTTPADIRKEIHRQFKDIKFGKTDLNSTLYKMKELKSSKEGNQTYWTLL